jgi:hypothetical protein
MRWPRAGASKAINKPSDSAKAITGGFPRRGCMSITGRLVAES